VGISINSHYDDVLFAVVDVITATVMQPTSCTAVRRNNATVGKPAFYAASLALDETKAKRRTPYKRHKIKTKI